MEQRPLRLGDIVDDYCPRERRLTNHAVVAIVDEHIRQTRCTTCDAEHVYKGGREPRRRKKDDSLFEQVLADVNGGQLVSSRPAEPAVESAPSAAAAPMAAAPTSTTAVAEPEPPADVDEAQAADSSGDDLWPGHRRLIRASLPRVDGEPPAPRPIPEFTMHQRPQGRGGRPFRFGGGHGGERNGNVAHPHGRDGHGHHSHDGQGQGHGQGRSGRRRRRRSR
ncbi:MAG TPA: hypothetical protein VG736_03225 [Vicinamibacterales bacterium]|jgi:hypothetical protein|nr:hypothetical protein [Vicinamibacterales bacterium]